ncbi:hypothetical protein TcWFU_001056 [Taenia crassiceps]|uniref:Uncharacterized protein n=1 Tax=Taenia crassiceps TaxID=6207 RepID=A0ABR4QA66_9CEST
MSIWPEEWDQPVHLFRRREHPSTTPEMRNLLQPHFSAFSPCSTSLSHDRGRLNCVNEMEEQLDELEHVFSQHRLDPLQQAVKRLLPLLRHDGLLKVPSPFNWINHAPSFTIKLFSSAGRAE